MSGPTAKRCARCQRELAVGNAYCMDCGYTNSDAELRSFNLKAQADRRIERAKLLSKWFRFIRFTSWMR